MTKHKRQMPIGAEASAKGASFRVWAPNCKKLEVVIERLGTFPMDREPRGYFSCFVPATKAGDRYFFKLSKKQLPDPASRFQPEGPLGPSCIVDSAFPWTDKKWPGIKIETQVLYEMHIGTFTPEGTYKSAAQHFKHLVSLGITSIQLMPLHEFPGKFGWGYDVTNPFAPYHEYGSPEDLKAFVNLAHRAGLGVILDVIYNHFSPSGSEMLSFAKEYLKNVNTEWGLAIHFESTPVREFYLENAKYWIREYHFDGLRIDATPYIIDSSSTHILKEVSQTVKRVSLKPTVIIGESERQDVKLLKPFQEGGYAFDSLWNDDFHHAAHVRLIGNREAYYLDYAGSPQEFISSVKYGFLYQGQYCSWQKARRGKPGCLDPVSKIVFLENHDQVANSSDGKRLLQVSDPRIVKALTALLLLGPNIPMLFQGQEFGSTKPFFYFVDLPFPIKDEIQAGRLKFLSQFERLKSKKNTKKVPNPSSRDTFSQSILDWEELKKNRSLVLFHKDLLQFRHKDPVFKTMHKIRIDGAILGPDSFILRYFGEKEDRLLAINLGTDYRIDPLSEPLLAPMENTEWTLAWSSESLRYDGEGVADFDEAEWKLLGHSAMILRPKMND